MLRVLPMPNWKSFRIAGIVFLLVISGTTSAPANEPAAIVGTGYQAPRQVGRVSDVEIGESSGLVASRTMPGFFWTHNDSGDSPRLFLLDGKGKTAAAFRVNDTEAVDWEDISHFRHKGKDHLLVADVGNNARRRSQVQLYLIEEPVVPKNDQDKPFAGKVSTNQTIRVQYEDGARNCESVAWDPLTRNVLLVTKQLREAFVYKVVIPKKYDGRILVAKRIGSMPISLATAMDISPDGKRMIVVGYLNGFEYLRKEGASWETVIATPPQVVKLPRRRQGEAVCYAVHSGAIYLTSEGRGAPFWMVPANGDSAGK